MSEVPLHIDEVAEAVSYNDDDFTDDASYMHYKHEVASSSSSLLSSLELSDAKVYDP